MVFSFFFPFFFYRELLELIKILFLTAWGFLSLLFPNLVEGIGRYYFFLYFSRLSLSVFLARPLSLKQKIIKVLENVVNLKIFHVEP